MLVLSRKVDEVICIGDDVEIQVIRISGGAVRLGIRAPRGVKIVRAEIVGRAPKADPGDLSGGAGDSGNASVLSLEHGEHDNPTLQNYCQRREFRRMLQTEPIPGRCFTAVELN